MVKYINFNGKEYPYDINFIVFEQWERETGKELGDIGEGRKATDAVNALKLLYFAIQDGCEQKGIEFNLTIKDFIRLVEAKDIPTLISHIAIGGEGLDDKKKQKVKLKPSM